MWHFVQPLAALNFVTAEVCLRPPLYVVYTSTLYFITPIVTARTSAHKEAQYSIVKVYTTCESYTTRENSSCRFHRRSVYVCSLLIVACWMRWAIPPCVRKWQPIGVRLLRQLFARTSAAGYRVSSETFITHRFQWRRRNQRKTRWRRVYRYAALEACA